MSSQEPHLDVVAALSLIGPAVDAHVLDRLRAQGFDGLRTGHGYVVQRLLVAPATATELADALGVSQQAVSKTTAELVGLGYVRQTVDPVDRRRRPVELTDRGVAAIDATRQIRAALARDIEAVVGPRRLTTAMKVLAGVIDVVGLADRVRSRSVTPPAGALE